MKACVYFFFECGEASDWPDKTVNVPTVNSLALREWMADFEGLKKVNAEMMGGNTSNSPSKRKQTKRRRKRLGSSCG